MKDLLYKEFKLSIHPAMFFFLLFGLFLLIPSWPYFIAFGYIFIAFLNIFHMCRANQDVFFTVSLPVRKRDAVRARVYAVAAIELLQIAVAIPFAILSRMIYTNGNMAGMNPNFAFFGFVFAMYAVFNVIFLPRFYQTAYKIGGSMILAVLAVTAYISAVECAVHLVPFLKVFLDSPGASHLLSQSIVLVAGIGVFALATAFACKRSAKNFEKVDL